MGAPRVVVLGLFLLGAGCVAPPDLGRSAAASHECVSPVDPCDDGDVCTTDRCQLPDGVCAHMRIGGCCTTVGECPTLPCTVPRCELDVCMYRAVLGCDAGVPGDDARVPDLDAGVPGDDAGSADRDAGDQDDGGDGGEPRADAMAEVPRVRGGACAATGRDGGSILWALGLVLLSVALSRRRVGVALGMITGLAVAAPAAAQGALRLPGHVAPLPDDLGALERAAPEPAAIRPGLRVAAVYADDPLVAEADGVERPLVDERLSVAASVTVAFLERAYVSALFALHAQGGLGAGGAEPGGPPLESPSLGSPALDARVVVLDREAPFELAVAVTARLPFGGHEGFAAELEASVAPRLLVARQLEPRGSFVGLSTGFDIGPEARLADLVVGPAWTFAIGGAAAITEQVSLTLELEGSTVLARAFDAAHTPLRGALGFRWRDGPFHLAGWAGAGLSQGYGSPDALVGLALGAWIPTE